MEIRRSLMGRPNLSVRGTVVGRARLVALKRDAGGNIPAGVSFPMRFLRSAGGAGVSASTLGNVWRGQSCPHLSLAAAAWVCPKAGAVRNSLHYRACGEGTVRARGFRVPEFPRPYGWPFRPAEP